MSLFTRTRVGLMLAVPLAVVLVASNPPAATEASWQRGEHASGSFAAITIPPPTLNGDCTYNLGPLGLYSYVSIYWFPPNGYDLVDAEMQASTSGLGSVLAPLTGFNMSTNTTGSPTAGYITNVRTNLLGGLLGLGTELQLSIVMKRYEWTSNPASVISNAGLTGKCRNVT